MYAHWFSKAMWQGASIFLLQESTEFSCCSLQRTNNFYVSFSCALLSIKRRLETRGRQAKIRKKNNLNKFCSVDVIVEGSVYFPQEIIVRLKTLDDTQYESFTSNLEYFGIKPCKQESRTSKVFSLQFRYKRRRYLYENIIFIVTVDVVRPSPLSKIFLSDFEKF